MDAKLTLSIRPDVIEKAKRWARKNGTSLSAAVEEFLIKSTKAGSSKETPLEKILRLNNELPQLSQKVYDQRKKEYLTKKYGSR